MNIHFKDLRKFLASISRGLTYKIYQGNARPGDINFGGDNFLEDLPVGSAVLICNIGPAVIYENETGRAFKAVREDGTTQLYGNIYNREISTCDGAHSLSEYVLLLSIGLARFG